MVAPIREKTGIHVKAGGLTPEGYQLVADGVGWESRTTKQARDLIINARHVVTAWEEGVLAGMGRASGTGTHYAHLSDIAVLPHLQGQGFGSAILRHLLKLVDREVREDATVTLHATPGTEPFYERFGFSSSATPFLMTRSRRE
ncbi:GNAT family N-acetyltransferase [Parvibaculaceae bacterium PLY_AMNH_Bact1]|nr:GNAT family N-acetyltransferase [Parvibaculaceae bacterium PLY_AMNH_Bact1]